MCYVLLPKRRSCWFYIDVLCFSITIQSNIYHAKGSYMMPQPEKCLTGQYSTISFIIRRLIWNSTVCAGLKQRIYPNIMYVCDNFKAKLPIRTQRTTQMCAAFSLSSFSVSRFVSNCLYLYMFDIESVCVCVYSTMLMVIGF